MAEGEKVSIFIVGSKDWTENSCQVRGRLGWEERRGRVLRVLGGVRPEQDSGQVADSSPQGQCVTWHLVLGLVLGAPGQSWGTAGASWRWG